MNKARILCGLDRIAMADDILKGRRVGLMTNPTGVNHELTSGVDILSERYRLTALFAVEHGIRGDAQAGDAIDTCVDPETGITVFSAYGKTARFTDEMLSAFDVLVFDIQDVGARFYTYIYSLAYAMEACARAGKSMVVLDRLNPLGGVQRSGTVLDLRFSSFVGDYELPTRYGLTCGEYARYIRDYLHLALDLTVIPLEGWERRMLLDDTDAPWVAPSPNCPTLSSALCYIGNCIFEGTNVSEGRGTTLPFELIGAPWIDGGELERRMNALGIPGARYRRASFRPTFSKYQGEICRGVQTHILDRERFDGFASGLHLLETIRALYPDQFSYLSPHADGRYMIDLLLGTDAFRAGKLSAEGVIAAHRPKVEIFSEKCKAYLMY